MKQYLGIVIAVVGVGLAGYSGYSKYKTKMEDAMREGNFARIQRDYLERVGWIRSNPDEKAYKDEVQTFFRWYFREINDHVNRFHGNPKFDGYLAELDKREKTGRDSQINEKRAAFDSLKKVFDEMRQGNYRPEFSASDKGMRLDVLPTTVQGAGSSAKIRFPIVLWGAQRELRDESTSAAGVVATNRRRMQTSSQFNVTWRLIDEKGKLLGEMTAAGDPLMKIDHPEVFIAEFPPQMVLGYYEFDLVPAEVARIEINFSVNSRSPSGGDAYASFPWKFDAPPAWKLKPGETWSGAQESVRPEEEIDPSKAARP